MDDVGKTTCDTGWEGDQMSISLGGCRFISSKEYKTEIEKLLKSQQALRIAVAFWGEGAENLFQKGTSLKIICNLESGATNPATIEALQGRRGATIKTFDRLHAKVFLGKGAAIIGSANASSNGLNLEGSEVKGWEEAGVFIKDERVIQEVGNWFDNIWNDDSRTKLIGKDDINKAKDFWDKRRRTREWPPNANGLTEEFTKLIFERPELAKDRPLYLVFYRKAASQEARDRFQQCLDQKVNEYARANFSFYECWPELPRGVALIDFHYGPQGGLRYEGTWEIPIDGNNVRFQYKDGGRGTLQICSRTTCRISDKKATRQQIRALHQKIQDSGRMDQIWDKGIGDDGGKYISLYDVIRIIKEP